MKKLLLLCIFFWLFGWCTNLQTPVENNENNSVKNSTQELIIKLKPFGHEEEQEIKRKNPDYSRMTVDKLYLDPAILNDHENHCGKDIYFLNAKYSNLTREKIIQRWPSKQALYFDRENDYFVFSPDWSLGRLEGNMLLTGYLKTWTDKFCPACDEEELAETSEAETRMICSDNSECKKSFDLGYTDGNSIVADFPNPRRDSIPHFSSYNKCTNFPWANLREIANDGKLHTFRVVIDDGGAQERTYFGSMIRERDFLQ